MENISGLKKIFHKLNTNKELEAEVGILFENLATEIEELRFFTTRYQRDQRVNENFIKKTVALLEESNDQLKKSNDRLLRTNRELIASNEELERFAYIASHDLKTPLYNIIRFTELLKSRLDIKVDSEIAEYMQFIVDGGKRMKNLIEDVLEYSKLSRGNNVPTASFSLKTIIAEIISSISAFLQSKNATVELVSPLPDFTGNRAKIFILFKNLIENGIRYNEQQHPIVKIDCKQEKDTCSIFIEDNGIGIEEEYFEKVFQMFTRLHNHATYEGTGLGLSLCKKIVEEYEGTISLESQLNVKTIVRLDFPAKIISQKFANIEVPGGYQNNSSVG